MVYFMRPHFAVVLPSHFCQDALLFPGILHEIVDFTVSDKLIKFAKSLCDLCIPSHEFEIVINSAVSKLSQYFWGGTCRKSQWFWTLVLALQVHLLSCHGDNYLWANPSAMAAISFSGRPTIRLLICERIPRISSLMAVLHTQLTSNLSCYRE